MSGAFATIDAALCCDLGQEDEFACPWCKNPASGHSAGCIWVKALGSLDDFRRLTAAAEALFLFDRTGPRFAEEDAAWDALRAALDRVHGGSQ